MQLLESWKRFMSCGAWDFSALKEVLSWLSYLSFYLVLNFRQYFISIFTVSFYMSCISRGKKNPTDEDIDELNVLFLKKEVHFLLLGKMLPRVLLCNQRKVCQGIWVGEGEMLILNIACLLLRLLSLNRSFKTGERFQSRPQCKCCPDIED